MFLSKSFDYVGFFNSFDLPKSGSFMFFPFFFEGGGGVGGEME